MGLTVVVFSCSFCFLCRFELPFCHHLWTLILSINELINAAGLQDDSPCHRRQNCKRKEQARECLLIWTAPFFSDSTGGEAPSSVQMPALAIKDPSYLIWCIQGPPSVQMPVQAINDHFYFRWWGDSVLFFLVCVVNSAFNRISEKNLSWFMRILFFSWRIQEGILSAFKIGAKHLLN